MKKITTIVDYGLGNIVSAQQSFLNVSQKNNWDLEVLISKNPTLFEVSTLESMDIDTRYDFELAKLLLKNKKYLMSHA